MPQDKENKDGQESNGDGAAATQAQGSESNAKEQQAQA